MTPRRSFAAVVLALSVASAACGLKPDASDALKQIQAGAPGGVVDPGVTDPGAVLPTAPDGSVIPTSGATVPGSVTNPNPQASGPGQAQGNPPAAVTGLQGSTKIGVTATTLKIGIHAPLTGASPLPQDSFESGSKLYWKNHKVLGRTVQVEVTDDTYKPSGAIKVCEEMARRDFLVIGGAGTDQIQACGTDKVLQRAHTPYLSAGVTTNGLTGIATYYAISLSYKEQGELVVKNAKMQGMPMTKWAIAISDTPNFDDAREAISSALQKAGVQFQVFKMAKAPSDSEAPTMANNLRTYGAPVVYFLGQPTFFLKVIGAAHAQVYHPIWTGVGISMGIGTVVEVACNATSNQYDGRFLSPFPGLDRAPKAFFDAGGVDDIELTLYGVSEMVAQMLSSTTGELTRENFINSIATRSFPGGVYPSVAFAPNDHFGGSAAWSLKSNCSKNGPNGAPGIYDTVGTAPIKV